MLITLLQVAAYLIPLEVMLEHILVCTERKIQHLSVSGRGNHGVAGFTVRLHSSPISLLEQSVVDFQDTVPLSGPGKANLFTAMKGMIA
jgi:hypothetical protein